MKALAVWIVVCLLSAGCSSIEPMPSDFLTSKDIVPVSTPSEIISSNLGQAQRVRFVSRYGKAYGMDSDAIVHFLSGGKVVLTELGYVPINYSGTYSISEGGVISLHLPKYPGSWPAMKMFSSKRGFYLFPVSRIDDLIMGGRGGAVETPHMRSFWPFKMVE